MKKYTRLSLFFVFAGLIFCSCKKDPVKPDEVNNVNQGELITTMKLTFTDQANSSNVVEAIFKDGDGDGGLDPTKLDTIRLESGKIYDVEILLLDETKNPADTISHEVEEEAVEHQFFFTATGAGVTIDYSDADDNGVPVGLLSEWTTGAATADKNGKVKIVLKHQGTDKPTSGTGDPAIGDTDIEVNFPILIQ